MDLATVTAIRSELEAEMVGSRFGKIFQLSKFELAVDLRLNESKYLFLSVEPGDPRAFLIKRRLRDLERASMNPTPFLLALRKHLSGAVATAVTQIENERVLLFSFDAVDELDDPIVLTLVAQLTGRSANLFLLDSQSVILETARLTRGDGQQIGDIFQPPERRAEAETTPGILKTKARTSISEGLDAADQDRSADKLFDVAASSARNKIKQEIAKRRKLAQKLSGDLAGHGNADTWKKFGDLLLANSSTARRSGGSIFVTDYFDDNAPEIAIEVDENDSTTEAAERFFKRYTKARNAGKEIESRLNELDKELARLNIESERIEAAIAERNEDLLSGLTGSGKTTPARTTKRSRVQTPSGTRSFTSSEGFEILVGKKAKDNDFLTFRIAKSLDTWMHAADYPGSHVVIRNPNRKEVPHRTLLEAAQLAAFYSQGKTQPKAAVHYTQKKFVNKPKGAAPGLVSLASFKTILVEPKIGEATMVTDKT